LEIQADQNVQIEDKTKTPKQENQNMAKKSAVKN
jgi:hypothetical protein